MASSAAARSRQTKTALESDDLVAMRAAEVAAWARRNVRTIVIATAVLGALLLGVVVWKMGQAARAEQAASQFLALQQDPTVATASGAARLEAFIRANDGTMEADEARLMLAELRLRNNQPKQAVEPARRVADGKGPLSIQAAMLLGDAQLQAGDRAAAIAAYQRAADRAELDMQRFEAWNHIAVVHETSGAYGEAVKVYERMLRETEKGSPREPVIQMRLTEARARAGGR